MRTTTRSKLEPALAMGYEYWVRNGLPVVRDGVVVRDAPDPLVTADA